MEAGSSHPWTLSSHSPEWVPQARSSAAPEDHAAAEGAPPAPSLEGGAPHRSSRLGPPRYQQAPRHERDADEDYARNRVRHWSAPGGGWQQQQQPQPQPQQQPWLPLGPSFAAFPSFGAGDPAAPLPLFGGYGHAGQALLPPAHYGAGPPFPGSAELAHSFAGAAGVPGLPFLFGAPHPTPHPAPPAMAYPYHSAGGSGAGGAAGRAGSGRGGALSSSRGSGAAGGGHAGGTLWESKDRAAKPKPGQASQPPRRTAGTGAPRGGVDGRPRKQGPRDNPPPLTTASAADSGTARSSHGAFSPSAADPASSDTELDAITPPLDGAPEPAAPLGSPETSTATGFSSSLSGGDAQTAAADAAASPRASGASAEQEQLPARLSTAHSPPGGVDAAIDVTHVGPATQPLASATADVTPVARERSTLRVPSGKRGGDRGARLQPPGIAPAAVTAVATAAPHPQPVPWHSLPNSSLVQTLLAAQAYLAAALGDCRSAVPSDGPGDAGAAPPASSSEAAALFAADPECGFAAVLGSSHAILSLADEWEASLAAALAVRDTGLLPQPSSSQLSAADLVDGYDRGRPVAASDATRAAAASAVSAFRRSLCAAYAYASLRRVASALGLSVYDATPSLQPRLLLGHWDGSALADVSAEARLAALLAYDANRERSLLRAASAKESEAAAAAAAAGAAQAHAAGRKGGPQSAQPSADSSAMSKLLLRRPDPRDHLQGPTASSAAGSPAAAAALQRDRAPTSLAQRALRLDRAAAGAQGYLAGLFSRLWLLLVAKEARKRQRAAGPHADEERLAGPPSAMLSVVAPGTAHALQSCSVLLLSLASLLSYQEEARAALRALGSKPHTAGPGGGKSAPQHSSEDAVKLPPALPACLTPSLLMTAAAFVSSVGSNRSSRCELQLGVHAFAKFSDVPSSLAHLLPAFLAQHSRGLRQGSSSGASATATGGEPAAAAADSEGPPPDGSSAALEADGGKILEALRVVVRRADEQLNQFALNIVGGGGDGKGASALDRFALLEPEALETPAGAVLSLLPLPPQHRPGELADCVRRFPLFRLLSRSGSVFLQAFVRLSGAAFAALAEVHEAAAPAASAGAAAGTDEQCHPPPAVAAPAGALAHVRDTLAEMLGGGALEAEVEALQASATLSIVQADALLRKWSGLRPEHAYPTHAQLAGSPVIAATGVLSDPEAGEPFAAALLQSVETVERCVEALEALLPHVEELQQLLQQPQSSQAQHAGGTQDAPNRDVDAPSAAALAVVDIVGAVSGLHRIMATLLLGLVGSVIRSSMDSRGEFRWLAVVTSSVCWLSSSPTRLRRTLCAVPAPASRAFLRSLARIVNDMRPLLSDATAALLPASRAGGVGSEPPAPDVSESSAPFAAPPAPAAVVTSATLGSPAARAALSTVMRQYLLPEVEAADAILAAALARAAAAAAAEGARAGGAEVARRDDEAAPSAVVGRHPLPLEAEIVRSVRLLLAAHSITVHSEQWALEAAAGAAGSTAPRVDAEVPLPSALPRLFYSPASCLFSDEEATTTASEDAAGGQPSDGATPPAASAAATRRCKVCRSALVTGAESCSFCGADVPLAPAAGADAEHATATGGGGGSGGSVPPAAGLGSVGVGAAFDALPHASQEQCDSADEEDDGASRGTYDDIDKELEGFSIASSVEQHHDGGEADDEGGIAHTGSTAGQRPVTEGAADVAVEDRTRGAGVSGGLGEQHDDELLHRPVVRGGPDSGRDADLDAMLASKGAPKRKKQPGPSPRQHQSSLPKGGDRRISEDRAHAAVAVQQLAESDAAARDFWGDPALESPQQLSARAQSRAPPAPPAAPPPRRPAPSVQQQPFRRAGIALPPPLVIIDGPNVACKAGGGSRFVSAGLAVAVEHFVSRGHRVVAFLPQTTLDPQSVVEARQACKLGLPVSPARMPDDLVPLKALVDKGHVTLLPRKAMDQAFLVRQALAHPGAIVLTNDMLRDWVAALRPDARPAAKQWLRAHVLTFAFAGGAAAVNAAAPARGGGGGGGAPPSFVPPAAASTAKPMSDSALLGALASGKVTPQLLAVLGGQPAASPALPAAGKAAAAAGAAPAGALGAIPAASNTSGSAVPTGSPLELQPHPGFAWPAPSAPGYAFNTAFLLEAMAEATAATSAQRGGSGEAASGIRPAAAVVDAAPPPSEVGAAASSSEQPPPLPSVAPPPRGESSPPPPPSPFGAVYPQQFAQQQQLAQQRQALSSGLAHLAAAAAAVHRQQHQHPAPPGSALDFDLAASLGFRLRLPPGLPPPTSVFAAAPPGSGGAVLSSPSSTQLPPEWGGAWGGGHVGGGGPASTWPHGRALGPPAPLLPPYPHWPPPPPLPPAAAMASPRSLGPSLPMASPRSSSPVLLLAGDGTPGLGGVEQLLAGAYTSLGLSTAGGGGSEEAPQLHGAAVSAGGAGGGDGDALWESMAFDAAVALSGGAASALQRPVAASARAVPAANAWHGRRTAVPAPAAAAAWDGAALSSPTSGYAAKLRGKR